MEEQGSLVLCLLLNGSSEKSTIGLQSLLIVTYPNHSRLYWLGMISARNQS